MDQRDRRLGDRASARSRPCSRPSGRPRLGLDLAGGVSVVYTAQGKHVSQADLDETVNILNLRVNGLGVSGAQVQTSGPNQISVSIPGVTDAQQVLDQIGQTARMYFRPVECWAYPEGTPKNPKVKLPTTGTEAIPACTSSLQLTAANLAVTPNSGPQGYRQHRATGPAVRGLPVDERRQARLRHQHGAAARASAARATAPAQVRCVLGPAQMTGRSIGSAQATQNQTGQWVVDYTLAGAAGSALWDKVAQENFHQFLGIELDGKVYSAPIIQPTQATFSSFDGKGEISGSLTQAQAQQLAQAMNFGALPVVLEGRDVGDGLGHARSLRAGRRSRRRHRRAGARPALRPLLLPGPRVGGHLRSGDHRHDAVGHHLGAGPYIGGAELRPRGHHGPHRVDRYHGRLVHRLFRTIERRGQIGPLRADVRRPRLQERLADRVGR